MAGKLIAHLAAWYLPTGRPDASGMEGLTVDGGYLLEADEDTWKRSHKLLLVGFPRYTKKGGSR